MPVKAARLALPADLPDPIGVAVSGGGDSIALLHLLRQRGREIEAATVDHGLRPDSWAEACAVRDECGRLGIRHEILTWKHEEITGNLMEVARLARMRLLADWAIRRGLPAVALAHTADDQAETLLMGLARAAGIDGLCGMRVDWRESGLRWIRPMLMIGRQELRDWLRGRDIDWVDDPSNDDMRFQRVRMRQLLMQMAEFGLTPARLARSAAHLAEARHALDHAVADAARMVVTEQAGALRFELTAYSTLPAEIARRLLQKAVMWLCQADHPPRARSLERLFLALTGGKVAQLSGCHLESGWLAREFRAVRSEIHHNYSAGEKSIRWDGRWNVMCDPGDIIRALSPDGLRQIAGWRETGLPSHVLEVMPSIWRREKLIAAPVVGYGGDEMKCAPSFSSFLQSH